jgi:hypothetical protein
MSSPEKTLLKEEEETEEIEEEKDREEEDAEATTRPQEKEKWRDLVKTPGRPVGTLFDGEVIARMDRTVKDYDKGGIKLYKRKLLEQGVEDTLDALNSTREIDDAFEEASGGFGLLSLEDESPDIEALVEYLNELKDWVWTRERAEYLLGKLKGQPEQIDQLLKEEPKIRELLEPDHQGSCHIRQEEKGT